MLDKDATRRCTVNRVTATAGLSWTFQKGCSNLQPPGLQSDKQLRVIVRVCSLVDKAAAHTSRKQGTDSSTACPGSSCSAQVLEGL